MLVFKSQLPLDIPFPVIYLHTIFVHFKNSSSDLYVVDIMYMQ